MTARENMSGTLTVKEAAKRFGVHANTLLHWCKIGTLPSWRSGTKGRLYIPAEEVAKRLAAKGVEN